MANGHGKKPEDFKKQMEDNFKVAPGEHTHVKKVIGIVSGKGGVGKSLVWVRWCAFEPRKREKK